jgi:hypothetical protein
MRNKLRKRISVFSVVVAFVLLVLAVGIFSVLEVVRPYFSEMKDSNLYALEQIECKGNIYDTSKFINAPTHKGPDYILTKERFFVQFSNDYPEFCLNFSEPNFFKDFRTPASYDSPTDERWRLYSRKKLIGDKNVEIMVGCIEKWQGCTIVTSSSSGIEQVLKEEADNIANSLKIENEKVSLPSEFRTKQVDGYQVVDAGDKRAISWAWLLPAIFPKEKILPQKGLSFSRRGNEVFLVRTDYGNGLTVVSLRSVGNIWRLGKDALVVFLLSFLLSYVISPAFFRKYFIFFQKNHPTISDALKSGEGQKVEFKRGLIDDDVLKSIAAFANTNDGTIFIGIDDDGKITGIDVKTPKEKDNFRNRIFNLIRNNINPYLLVDIDFEESRGYVVSKIFVPRGEDLFYFLDGVIYVRDGGSDRKNQPEIVKKIIFEHAF